MSPVFVTVVDVIFHQPPQMLLVQNNDVVQEVSPNPSNPALGDAILPGTAVRGAHRPAFIAFAVATTSTLNFASCSIVLHSDRHLTPL
jgi:hypothetical protein